VNVKSMFDLSHEKAIVTGASRGLGKEMALALAEAGADVAIADINLEEAKKVVQQIVELGRDSVAIKADISKTQDVENMVKEAKSRFGKIDILINNAGIARIAPAEEMTKEEWDRVLDVNLTGVFLCAQAVGREMIKQRKGNIINISSMSALIVNKPQKILSYCVSKAGVSMLTKVLATEWAKYNIRVNAIAPGYMKTPLVVDLLEKWGDEWRSLTPMGRLGDPREIKGLAVFLASRASSFMTGSILLMDGGYTAW